MAKNWAITIGVNKYARLQPLNYAKRDAQLMHDFLLNEASFEKVFFFSDDSPDRNGKSTRPNRANLRGVLRELFSNPFMGAGDNFWFFFSGHGIRHNNRDYLMPYDGDTEDIEETAIPINYVTERLRQCGADNIVLILDACRNLTQKGGEGIGRQTAEEARQQGVISIFSCSPQEYSYEIPALEQGAFTRALLDGLGIKGQCATVERLNQYLSLRVPEIVRQHHNGRQTPYIIAEPVNKSHLILVPRHATLADIANLKIDAYQAEVTKDNELAEQLWIRVLSAAGGTDMDAIKGIQRIERLKWESPGKFTSPPSSNVPNSGQGASSQNSLKTPQFEVVTVDAIGKIINRRNCDAKYLVEDLGNGVTLEMVQIPGGTFMMGSPETEEGRYDRESPQHQVTVPSFFIGKYQVTQSQYQAVMDINPSNFLGKKRPVEKVSWDDAVEFCQKLSQKTGRTYRLPTEAEWEYSCRAGTTTPFYFGETITTELANYRGTDLNYEGTIYPGNYGLGQKGKYREETTPVDSFPPNTFGLYDMHGNVWEWCQDSWHDKYNDAPTNGSAWIDNNEYKMLRGGSWHDGPRRCRCASRNYYARAYRVINVGIRVVMVLA
jgi:formylglycine-generating enzyme required for sulfatase activity